MIGYLLSSILIAFGMAVIIVEKGKNWPVKYWRVNFKKCVRNMFGRKMSKVFDCSVCLSFWTALIADLGLLIASHEYFLWPLSGFAASGVTWAFYVIMDTLETKEYPF